MQSKLAATIGLAVLLAAPAAMAQNGGTSGQNRGYISPRSSRRARHHYRSRIGSNHSARFRAQPESDRDIEGHGGGSDYDLGRTAEAGLGDDGGEESSGAGDRIGGTGNGGGGVLPR